MSRIESHPDELTLQQWAEGLLPSSQQASDLENHLEGCLHCQETLTAYQKLNGLLAQAAPLPVPADLAELIVQRLRQETLADASLSKGWQLLALLALALAAGLLLSGLLEANPVYRLAELAQATAAGARLVREAFWPARELLAPLLLPGLTLAALPVLLMALMTGRRLTTERVY